MKEALMKEYAKMFTEKVAVIHSAFDEKPTTVAFVEVAKELSDEEKCEVAFKKTNTIEKAWWENEGVTKMFGGDMFVEAPALVTWFWLELRSTSVLALDGS